jgi:anti-anti-sigma regulatory factor
MLGAMARLARAALTWHRHDETILLDGAIDERAQLVELVGEARDGRLVLDSAGVTFINSLGLRAWIRVLDEAAAAGVRVELRRVAEPIVHQLNLVVAARGTATVTSFYVPYVCEHCDTEKHVLLDVAEHGRDLARGVVPAHACPSCRRAMTVVHPPDLYFAFVAQLPPTGTAR